MTDEPYALQTLSREDVDALPGVSVIDFGTQWCGHCNAAQPLIGKVMADYPHVRRLKIEDGSGRRLGRSFKIKLWPTLVFMRDGQEVGRLVRPTRIGDIEQAFQGLATKA